MKLEYNMYKSELLGPIYIVSDGEAIISVQLFEEDWQQLCQQYEMVKSNSPLLENAVQQLDDYFHGKRKTCHLTLKRYCRKNRPSESGKGGWTGKPSK